MSIHYAKSFFEKNMSVFGGTIKTFLHIKDVARAIEIALDLKRGILICPKKYENN